MHRRTLLKALTAAPAAGLLAACARTGQASSTGDDPLTRVAPQAAPILTLITAQAQLLAGDDEPFAFALYDLDNRPLTSTAVKVWMVPEDGEPRGPIPATYHPLDLPKPLQTGLGLVGSPRGVYLARIDVPHPGVVTVVAAAADGRAAQDAIHVVSREDSLVPLVGAPAVAVATPTVSNPGPLTTLCTRQPPCDLHQHSLDAMLAQGRPVALVFATPAFCSSAICGPALDVILAARAARDWGDLAWIHQEIYTDQAVTLAPAVRAWGLPSEPWLFTIDRDGLVAGRADGPLLAIVAHITELVEEAR